MKSEGEVFDCPDHAGFIVEAGSGCKYEHCGTRVYFSGECTAFGDYSLKYEEKDGKLVGIGYTSKDCTGDGESEELGSCGTCLEGGEYLQCGTISNMVILLLALIFFMF